MSSQQAAKLGAAMEAKLSNRIGALIVTLLVLVLFVVSNPSSDRHRQAIRDEMLKREPVAGALGLGALASGLPVYHSFVVGSYTTVDSEVASFGIMGLVWVN